jgi:hypothetical protein
MPYQPPQRLESIFSALVPPSSRDHVLGDLAECAHTRGQYLAAFAAVLPRVVLSQVRRRVRADDGLSLMAALTIVALGIAAVVTRGRGMAVPGEWLRWAAPAAVWLLGCALAAAYGPPGTRLWNGKGVLAALAASIAVAAATGAHVGAVAAAIVVASAAHLAITLPRAATDLARVAAAARVPLSLDNLADQARTFQRRIWWRNMRESLAAVVVLTANINNLTSATSSADLAGPLLTVAGVVSVLVVLHTIAGPRRVPATSDTRALLRFHQSELMRQRSMLRFVPLWYLLPLVPGMLAGVIAKGRLVPGLLSLAVMAIVFYGVARLNQWGARWLDDALAETRALERSA